MLRDVTRHAVRDEVLRRAWQLFATQGFEATTVDQIAEASGMSRRTFFRYFPSKDELVVVTFAETGAGLAAALDGRPTDEDAWTALRATFDGLVRTQEAIPGRAQTLWTMLSTEPSLRAAMEERRRRWVELLTPLVAARIAPGRGREMRAAAVAGAALACFDAAQHAWAAQAGPGGPRLSTLLDHAMGAVETL